MSDRKPTHDPSPGPEQAPEAPSPVARAPGAPTPAADTGAPRPRPAREHGEAGSPSAGGPGGKKRGGRHGPPRGGRDDPGHSNRAVTGTSKPRPARSIERSPPGPAREPQDVEAVSIVVDGTAWTVRVLGRAAAGAHAGGAPLIMLGFRAEEDSSAQAEREALVVGTSLTGLGEAALESAFRASRAVRA